ncbi:hypothetical protein [Flagellimonas sp.]|uniref:hypothetical protein n=1 Tax=Flagellimonas sp. TaxID=2058762 RepID=UPI003BAC42EC
MADIVIDDVVKEVNTYLAHNPDLISASINRAESVLDKHTTPLTKVKGKFPQGSTILSNVVQGFEDVWNELGAMQIDHKILMNYHQKVNFAINPSDILGSYWAHLYAENITREDMPISKYIVEQELLPKVIDDLAFLEIKGVYDANDLATFGKSMNGIEAILAGLLTEVPGTGHTPFKIPLSALTDTNIVDQVTLFERQIPSKIKSKIKKIFMSENNYERYVLQYEEQFGQNQFQKDAMKTRLGKREIVALPGMDTDDIFATPDVNFKRLIDVFDGKPAVTDIQKQDYKVKFFMEFWKGYDFMINEMVLMANYADAEYGLGSTPLNQKYYSIDGVTVA